MAARMYQPKAADSFASTPSPSAHLCPSSKQDCTSPASALEINSSKDSIERRQHAPPYNKYLETCRKSCYPRVGATAFAQSFLPMRPSDLSMALFRMYMQRPVATSMKSST